jgi:hypothetical protein
MRLNTILLALVATLSAASPTPDAPTGIIDCRYCTDMLALCFAVRHVTLPITSHIPTHTHKRGAVELTGARASRTDIRAARRAASSRVVSMCAIGRLP